ncbi:MAG: CpaF family protein [Bacillota bacterium]
MSLIRRRMEEKEATSAPRARAEAAAAVGRERAAEVEERVRRALYARLDSGVLQDDEKLRRLVAAIADREGADLQRHARAAVVERILQDVLGYGPIQPLIDDPEVTEVMVNRYDRVYYEKNGRIHRAENIVFRDEEHVRTVIQKIVGPVGRRIDQSSPMVDARLPDGSRVNAAVPPVAVDGACITIRKFGKRLTAGDLLRLGTLDEATLEFLQRCVEAKVNVVVLGGTGSGKTTLLNVLSSFIPAGERVVTIEDTVELQLQQEHVVRLETRPPNIEGRGEIAMRDLVRNALRMRPDRIVVGECRGGEALDMLQAMNTGHEGSLTTIHANSPQDAISRLEVMVLQAGGNLPRRAVLQQIVASVELFVQAARFRDGSRKVVAVSEPVETDGESVVVRDLARYDVREGRLVWSVHEPRFMWKFEWYGVPVPRVLAKERGGGSG